MTSNQSKEKRRLRSMKIRIKRSTAKIKSYISSKFVEYCYEFAKVKIKEQQSKKRSTGISTNKRKQSEDSIDLAQSTQPNKKVCSSPAETKEKGQMINKRKCASATKPTHTKKRAKKVNGIIQGRRKKNQDSSRKMFERWNFGPPTHTCPDCGAKVWFEERNRKQGNLENPNFTICCGQGKVKLPLFREPPQLLLDLLNYLGGKSAKLFRRLIRKYNNMFAFTSMGANIDKDINKTKGPYVFKINGENYHQIGTLLPILGRHPRFAQLYIYDTDNEIRNRMSSIDQDTETSELDKKIVEELIKMLDRHNQLTKTFRMARDRYKNSNSDEFTMKLIGSRTTDGRTYNLPTSTEIGALLTGTDDLHNDNRDIIIESKNGFLQRIDELHPSYMALQYPLLFPYGEDSFRLNIKISDTIQRVLKGGDISIREFYAYIIQERKYSAKTLLKGGRLFQQFLVDAYTCVEQERIKWVRLNQRDLRAELYSHVKDAILDGDTTAAAVGRRIVLPSSFVGGPRYMNQSFQDAIAICRWAGTPDYFITITCDPKWPEIQYFLSEIPGQKPEDRPEVVSRGFKIKLDHLMDDFYCNEHFGQVVASCYTIEFQKRGLPHAHILLWVHEKDKPNTTEKIDKVISAELPDKDKDPDAYKAVVDFMIHGPCGEHNRKSPCMDDRNCLRHFPRKQSDVTVRDSNGYYFYRRRKDGRTAEKNGIVVDNTWVVPHNIDLLIKYQCHINVEVCNEAQAIKYLFKYMHKGEDRSKGIIHRTVKTKDKDGNDVYIDVDEVSKYLDCRFLSAAEAAWRIFAFETQFRDPSVERLPFHLENEQPLTFKPHEKPSEILQKISANQTKFLEWMKVNQVDPNARQYTYVEFPLHYVWCQQEKKWHRREKGLSIGRIYFANPTEGERYYLRLLLNHVRGAQNFKDFKTVGKTVYDTYREACVARGLLDDDGEWNEALKEAAQWACGKSLRNMFVTMLLFCEVSDPLELWNKNWQNLSDDILYNARKAANDENFKMSEVEIKAATLCDLELILNANHKSLKDFPPMPTVDLKDHYNLKDRMIQAELNYDREKLKEECSKLMEQLNDQQREVFNTIVDSAINNKGGLYFIYGSGGTGKTFLWNTIISRLRSERKIVLPVASSGIASLLLPGGRTAHSRFKIPLEVDEFSTCSIGPNTELGRLVVRADLIIWDEAPMNHKHVFEAVDKTLRDLMNNPDNAFGGKTVILGGDFRQTLPVIPKASRDQIVTASINKSYLWDYCRVFHLTENMRLKRQDLDQSMASEIKDFSQWVLDIGNGKLPGKALRSDEEESWIDIPDDILLPPTEDNIEQIIESTYPQMTARFNSTDFDLTNYVKDRCILAPTNDIVDKINSKIVSQITTNGKTFLSADTVSPMSEDVHTQDILYPTEFLNTLHLPGLPSHKLEVKIGVPIMLIRNINPSEGLCNGTRLIVTDFKDKVIQAKIMTGTHVGNIVPIHRIVTSSKQKDLHFILRRRQFPIKICFAMTINKSQGQTLNHVGLYLPTPVFSHGQLYVAVSRVTSRKGLKIKIESEDPLTKGMTKNIVYKEVFDSLHTDTIAMADKHPIKSSNNEISRTSTDTEIQGDTDDIATKSTTEPDNSQAMEQTTSNKNTTRDTNLMAEKHTRKSSNNAISRTCTNTKKQGNTDDIETQTLLQRFSKFYPTQFRAFIISCHNPLGDGNCGFRAFCHCLGIDENEWPWMRRILKEEVERNQIPYTITFGDGGPEKLINLITHYSGSATEEKYMEMPATGFVMAELFNVVVVSLSERSCWTCLPTRQPPPSGNIKVYAIAYHSNHYISLTLEENCPIPPIPNQYYNVTNENISHAWTAALQWRLDAWRDLDIRNLYPTLCPTDHIFVFQ